MKILLSGLLIMAFTGAAAASPMPVPAPPTFDAHSYILEDFDTGRILAEYHPDQRVAPASLTKLMTLYVVFHALRAGTIKLTDPVTISAKAWRTGGSR
ncbi:MAG: D-alanyl-D-alanine carboxypeptidase, partial [Gammaproteobacteria bacterium]|nr:D-alanyl-D-alanine carboxypeptidase [Gammaproteobacteria bacterium]